MQILKAKETDQRAQLFQRTLKSGNEMLSANRKLLLRMRLYVFLLTLLRPIMCSADTVIRNVMYRQQAELIVKPPRRTPTVGGQLKLNSSASDFDRLPEIVAYSHSRPHLWYALQAGRWMKPHHCLAVMHYSSRLAKDLNPSQPPDASEAERRCTHCQIIHQTWRPRANVALRKGPLLLLPPA